MEIRRIRRLRLESRSAPFADLQILPTGAAQSKSPGVFHIFVRMFSSRRPLMTMFGILRRTCFVAALLLPFTVASNGGAQQKQRFASLNDALAASGTLAGRGAPQNIVWLDGGRRFSFI